MLRLTVEFPRFPQDVPTQCRGIWNAGAGCSPVLEGVSFCGGLASKPGVVVVRNWRLLEPIARWSTGRCRFAQSLLSKAVFDGKAMPELDSFCASRPALDRGDVPFGPTKCPGERAVDGRRGGVPL